jgi:2-dehydropantoate 2-reductase
MDFPMNSPPIHIVGAGGIGCVVGYALCSAGRNVTFIDTDATKIAWGRAHGVRVDRRPSRPATFLHFDDWQPAPHQTVLLCTKCYDNAAVLARLPWPVNLVPIQNGFDGQLDANGHALEGIASFVSECLPGRTHARITRRGRLHLGFRTAAAGGSPANGAPQPDPLAKALHAAGLFPVEVVPDIRPYKYTKLMYNAAISPLAAAAGLDNGQLLSVPPARRLFFELLRENYAILRAANIALARIGPFHPDTVQRILRHWLLARGLAWAFYPTLRGSYCSMSGDLPRGRTEIDYYNGHLIALADQQRGFASPCPLNRRVYALVKRMAAEQLPPGVQRLNGLASEFTQRRG